MILSKKIRKKSKKNKKKKGGMNKNNINDLNSEPSYTNNDSQESSGSDFPQKLSSKAQKKIIGSSYKVKGKEDNNNNKNQVVQGLPNIYLNNNLPHMRRMVSLPSISDKSNESNNGRKSALSNSGIVKFVREYMTPKQGAKLRATTPNQSKFSYENTKYQNIPYKKLENHYLYPSFSECNNVKNIKEKYICNEEKFHENITGV